MVWPVALTVAALAAQTVCAADRVTARECDDHVYDRRPPLFANVTTDMTEEELEISRSTPGQQFPAKGLVARQLRLIPTPALGQKQIRGAKSHVR